MSVVTTYGARAPAAGLPTLPHEHRSGAVGAMRGSGAHTLNWDGVLSLLLELAHYLLWSEVTESPGEDGRPFQDRRQAADNREVLGLNRCQLCSG